MSNVVMQLCFTWVCPECGERQYHLGTNKFDEETRMEAAEGLGVDPTELVAEPSQVFCIKCESRFDVAWEREDDDSF